jgi:hypothetical protein
MRGTYTRRSRNTNPEGRRSLAEVPTKKEYQFLGLFPDIDY